MDIASEGLDIVSGVNLLGGVDLLQQYPQIAIKNMFAINVVDQNIDADDTNLGSSVKVVILTDEEVASVSTV